MTLGEKLRHLRTVEGELRGVGRPLSKSEVVRGMRERAGAGVSLPYLSQLETGTRPHLTASSRALLAQFFRVHPGYLVSDPEGFEEAIASPVDPSVVDLGEWLALRAEEQRQDAELYEALLRIASHSHPRALLITVAHGLGHETPTEMLGE